MENAVGKFYTLKVEPQSERFNEYRYLRWLVFCKELGRVGATREQEELMQEEDVYDSRAAHYLIVNENNSAVGFFRLISSRSIEEVSLNGRYEWNAGACERLKECPLLEISRFGLLRHVRGNMELTASVIEESFTSIASIAKAMSVHVALVAIEPRFARLLRTLGMKINSLSAINKTLTAPRAVYEFRAKE